LRVWAGVRRFTQTVQAGEAGSKLTALVTLPPTREWQNWLRLLSAALTPRHTHEEEEEAAAWAAAAEVSPGAGPAHGCVCCAATSSMMGMSSFHAAAVSAACLACDSASCASMDFCKTARGRRGRGEMERVSVSCLQRW